MLPRFFAPEAARSDAESTVALPEDEAVHAARVLRLSTGDSVRVFDGTGREWRAEIVKLARHSVWVTLREPFVPASEPRIAIRLALAVLKGDKMDDVVRDAVMLGAAAIQPLVTERTETSLAALSRARRLARWQRVAVASCKQCGRAVVPPVREPLMLDAWIGHKADGLRLLLVEPGASVETRPLHDVPAPQAADLIVGPEGGWSDLELATVCHAGAQPVTLGALTLRADAVPLIALTALRTVWRDLS